MPFNHGYNKKKEKYSWKVSYPSSLRNWVKRESSCQRCFHSKEVSCILLQRRPQTWTLPKRQPRPPSVRDSSTLPFLVVDYQVTLFCITLCVSWKKSILLCIIFEGGDLRSKFGVTPDVLSIKVDVTMITSFPFILSAWDEDQRHEGSPSVMLFRFWYCDGHVVYVLSSLTFTHYTDI